MRDEKAVKRRVKAALDKSAWYWFSPPSNAYGKAGIADIIALKSGVFMAIETKFGTNKPTALQVGFLNSVRAEDGFAFVVSDRNIEWFETWLECFDRSTAAASRKEMPADEDGAGMLDAIRALTVLL